MSWLDDMKVVDNKNAPKPTVESGTRVVRLDLGGGYTAVAIPQWLQGTNVSIPTWMSQLDQPHESSLMLTKEIHTSIESALRAAIYFRRNQMLEELVKFEKTFYS